MLSDISGEPSDRFSEASDRSGPIALADATARVAISSKMNGMRANGCALRGLARMLLTYPPKKRQLTNKQREGTSRCQPVFNS